MNFVPGARRCDCLCYTCSQKGYVNILLLKKENWGPVQPRWFKIRAEVCEIDDDDSWKHILAGKRITNDKPKILGQAAMLDQPLFRKNQVDQDELPEVDEGLEEMLSKIMVDSVNKKKPKFTVTTNKTADQDPADLVKTTKQVRFADMIEEENDDEEREDPSTIDDAKALLEDLIEQDKEEVYQGKNTQGLLCTKSRQARYRHWLDTEAFVPVSKRNMTKQARMRSIVNEEIEVLIKFDDKAKRIEAAKELEYGTDLVDHIELAQKQTNEEPQKDQSFFSR